MMERVPRLPTQALALLAKQDNVVATWQLDRPTSHQMRQAHNRGVWRQLTRFTYLAAPCEPTEAQLRWAAALHVGPAGLLSGQAALACAEWCGKPSAAIDVLTSAATNRRSTPRWLQVHRTTVMPRAALTGIPRAIPVAAAIDAASWARTNREAMFIVVSVLQQRLTTPREIERLLRGRPTVKRRNLVLETVTEFRGGATSMSEIDFGALCRKYGLRQPDRQIRRKDARGRSRFIDVHFDAEAVTVEIDGLQHLELEIWLDDQDRQNELVIAGNRTFLRVSTWVLKHNPAHFMAQLARALGQSLNI